MRNYTFSLACLLLSLVSPIVSEESSDLSSMQKFRSLVRSLASDSGFTDEDAINASVFLLSALEGNRPKGSILTKTIKASKPKSIKVFVAYDFGIWFIGYDIEFSRGDLSKNIRTASLNSITVVPSQ